MIDLGLTLILAMLVGFHVTLLVLAWLIFREFGRVVHRRVLSRKARLRYRLRTLLILAAVIQGAVAWATWQIRGRPFSLGEFLPLLAVDFVLLGIGLWMLWYWIEEMVHVFGRRRSVYRKYGAGGGPEAASPSPPSVTKRRTKWWAKVWPDRYRQLRPGQDYRLPTGRDRF